jgi:hypothetical protein
MEARGLRQGESVVVFYLDIAGIIMSEMVTDDFIYIHEGIIQLLCTMYLSLIFKSFFIHIFHKIVDTFIVVNEKVVLKLSLKIDRDDNFFIDNDFTKFD